MLQLIELLSAGHLKKKPVGKEIAGWPVALNGDVKAAYGIDLSEFLIGSSSVDTSSPTRGGGTRVVGVSRRSQPLSHHSRVARRMEPISA
ncbi:MAG: hypothetical protein Ct9H90mP30_6560 [Actinomycetota bacterium]|nr:MAG: hypothetical protein Ct9H90mP30_6560 [Actinomycetota bacterium]